MTKAQAAKIKQLLPLIEIIKAKCLECSAGSLHEVKMCPCLSCPNFPYRLGINSPKQNSTGENVRNKSKDGSGYGD